MSDVVWEEPPARTGQGRARKDWAAVAAELKARPGQWAVIDTDCNASASYLYKSGRNRAFPKGEFEFTSSGAENGRVAKLYARYIGGEA